MARLVNTHDTCHIRQAWNWLTDIVICVGIHILACWTRCTGSRIKLYPAVSRCTYTILPVLIHCSRLSTLASAVRCCISESTIVTFTISTMASCTWVSTTNFSSAYITTIICSLSTNSLAFTKSILGITRYTCTIRPTRHLTIIHSGTYSWVTIMNCVWARGLAGAITLFFISNRTNTWSSSLVIRNIAIYYICTLINMVFVTIIS